MATNKNHTEYMRLYRVRYGLTKSVLVPVDVLAKVLEQEWLEQNYAPMTVHLGDTLASAILETYSDIKVNSYEKK